MCHLHGPPSRDFNTSPITKFDHLLLGACKLNLGLRGSCAGAAKLVGPKACLKLTSREFVEAGELLAKAETHDNDPILTLIILYHHKVVDNELEVARNFTWAVLGMEDGNF